MFVCSSPPSLFCHKIKKHHREVEFRDDKPKGPVHFPTAKKSGTGKVKETTFSTSLTRITVAFLSIAARANIFQEIQKSPVSIICMQAHRQINIHNSGQTYTHQANAERRTTKKDENIDENTSCTNISIIINVL